MAANSKLSTLDSFTKPRLDRFSHDVFEMSCSSTPSKSTQNHKHTAGIKRYFGTNETGTSAVTSQTSVLSPTKCQLDMKPTTADSSVDSNQSFPHHQLAKEDDAMDAREAETAEVLSLSGFEEDILDFLSDSSGEDGEEDATLNASNNSLCLDMALQVWGEMDNAVSNQATPDSPLVHKTDAVTSHSTISPEKISSSLTKTRNPIPPTSFPQTTEKTLAESDSEEDISIVWETSANKPACKLSGNPCDNTDIMLFIVMLV